MAATSKAEYLKRYLSGPTEDNKKKKKKKKAQAVVKIPKSRVVDDDLDMKVLQTGNLENRLEDDIIQEEDQPVVADMVDERPQHIIELERFRMSKQWKGIHKKGGRKGFDSDSDSAGNRQRLDSDSDASPARRPARHDSDSDSGPDQSPLRKKTRHDSDESPPRRTNRHDSDSDSDQSPPRKHKDSEESSSKRKVRHDSDSDQSPPRRKGRKGSDSDQSPPRRKGRKGSDSDQSPTRQIRDHKSERRRKKRWDSSPDESPNRSRKDDSGGKMSKTLGGAKAGLSTAREMRYEATKLKEKEDQIFSKIGEDRLGRHAKTVFRDKSGKRRNLAEEAKEENAKQAKEDEKLKKYQQWGAGLKQIEDHNQAIEDAIHETSKPLARYKDDDDLDDMLKHQDREGDPMLAFMKKKKSKGADKTKEKPTYRGPEPPPNRFGIRPGYRWDGVNRSNGFESKLFASIADRKAVKDMAHKWSVEDM